MTLVSLLFRTLKMTAATLIVVAFAMGSVGGALSAAVMDNAQYAVSDTDASPSGKTVAFAACAAENGDPHSDHEVGGMCCVGMCLMTTLVVEPDSVPADAPLVQSVSGYSGLIARGRIFDMMRPPSQTI